MAKCWICGDPADSGEHGVKTSDIRLFFGKISPTDPVYFHTDVRRNIPIHSAKSNKFKIFDAICRRCNSTDTAPYDRAWQKLSEAISSKHAVIRKSGQLKLQKVFPGCVRKELTKVHLFFVKIFGCRIVDDPAIPIDITGFKTAVRNGDPHPLVFLTFSIRKQRLATKYIGLSEIAGKKHDGTLVSASWYYTLGELDVQVTWFLDAPIQNVPCAWHPSSGGKLLQFRPR